MIKNICVFCSTFNPDNRFLKEVEILGKLFAKKQLNVIYGGGDKGLMGLLAKSVIDNGGSITGIVPEFLINAVKPTPGLSKLIIAKDMHDRKMKMYSLSDVFLTLPGGIGTLDEMTEVLTWNQLKIHNKKLIIANFENYWLPYINLLNHLNDNKFLKDQSRLNYLMANDPNEILNLIDTI
ncbi:MAG: TIGR00730 family Rossman fold protein [Hyphomicrobiales bacterium]|nr:TIGR00730 family Rossman fold protein [Hyphomicrobiales bacterium]|tara:strand:+ start:200 stop:739 length:540 start_codon:yes stop_codon:yes gene_type:complete